MSVIFFFQAEDGIRDLVRSRGLGDVYKRQPLEPEHQEGNWGVNFKFNPDFLRGQTLGLYYREFDEKIPWVFLALPTMDNPKPFGYRAVYAENTKVAGVSFDGQIGQWAVGGEVGYHMDTGLKSTGFALSLIHI